MLSKVTFFCYLSSVFCHETVLESNLKWFFNKMEHDRSFRNYLIGSSEMDELSQTLNYLEHPLTDWLVLLDPENWPESKYFGVMLDSSQKTCQKYKSGSGGSRGEKYVVFPNFHTWTNSANFKSNISIQCLDVKLKSFSPFQRLLVASDFKQNQLLKNPPRQNYEKSNNISWQPRMLSDNWQPSEIEFREAPSVNEDYIETNQPVAEKNHESTEFIEVIEMNSIVDKNLNEKPQVDNVGTYETAFYIVVSLFLAFFVVLLLTLAIYCFVRKKTGNSADKSSSIVKGNDEPEPLDNEIEVVKEAMEKRSLPYSIKAPTVVDFPKEFAKAYTKEEALSLGVSWDFPTPEKFKTSPKKPQDGNEEHHPDFYNHTPLVMSPQRLNKSD